MKNLILLSLLAASPRAFAIESTGKLGFYKGAEHSSTSHLLVEGAAAADLYQHLNQAPQTEEPVEGIFIRRGKSLECLSFYKEPGTPTRCYLHMDEAGLIEPGYAPSF